MISLIRGIYWAHWTDKRSRDRPTDGGLTATGGEGRRRDPGQRKKASRTWQQCGDCKEGAYGGSKAREKNTI